MTEVISVKNLHVSYDGFEAIGNISFSTQSGTIVGVIGPNGAGKSTLLKSLIGLEHTDSGEVQIFGQPVKANRKRIAYVPQRSNIDWNFPITVLDTVVIGTYPGLGVFKRPGKREKDWAYECLRKVGMENFSKKQIGELSGGQQQRVFLARALAQNADLFFLDEPFVGIDITSEETIINILRELRDADKTVFVVHHDLSKAETYFDKLLLLNKQLIGYGAVQEVLKPETIKRAYQGQLSFLDAIGVKLHESVSFL
ncbi:MAG TPA: metal ABC transporter ATP-binding protein [Bacilli bacterium]